jgi:hypothetical protein
VAVLKNVITGHKSFFRKLAAELYNSVFFLRQPRAGAGLAQRHPCFITTRGVAPNEYADELVTAAALFEQ